MAVLRVREYSRINCGESFSPENGTVTQAQRRTLERFSEAYKRRHKVSVLEYGPSNALVAQSFVGVINLGRDQVEVLPKIDGLEGLDGQARTNLAAMIAASFNLALRDGDASKMDTPSETILEILIRLFCRQLWIEIHKGMLRSYEPRSESLNVVRGTLEVGRQIQRNLLRPDRLECDFDEFTENNPINQTLKAALRCLSQATRTGANARSVSELLCCFDEVDDVTLETLGRAKFEKSRISARYERLLRLARMFLRNQAPDVTAGEGTGYALLFDMNDLFEKYIGSLVRRLYAESPIAVSLQGPTRHLATRADGALAFELRPDVVGRLGDRTAWIVDTKWKRLDVSKHREGVSAGDMYQMHAYAKRYESPEVLLLYPHHHGLGLLPGRRAAYRLEVPPGSASQIVSVGTVDIRDLSKVQAQLSEMLAGCGVPYPSLALSAQLSGSR